MNFKVNFNETVRVKLTETGRHILKKRHNDLIRDIIEGGGNADSIKDYDLRLDEDGYYVTQLWILTKTFGPHMGMLKFEGPFEMDVVIENGKPIEGNKNYVTKHLRMMGYEVYEDSWVEGIRVSFKTRKGFVAYTTISDLELESNFDCSEMLALIVNRINHIIEREL
jgi:hypothetical protein